MENLNFPILTALVGYGVLMLGISLYWMRRVKQPVDLLLANRGLGTLALTGTVLATGIGTGVTLGASGHSYVSGWGGALYPVGLGAGIIVTGVLFAEMRKYKFMTLSEEIACYYGGNRILYNFSSVMLFLSKVCWLTVQVTGGALIINLITGIELKLCILIAGVLMAVTAIPGGLLTVVYTDIVQACILLSGFVVLTIVALERVDGFEGLKASVPTGYFSFFGVEILGWKKVISLFFVLIVSMISDTNNRHRIYSSISEKTAKWSLVVAGSFEICFAALIGITGMCVFALNPKIVPQDQAIPWLIIEVLPTWVAAVVVVAISAAIFSSGDSDAAVSATFFVRHIYPMCTGRYPRKALAVGRWSLVWVFLAATFLALTIEAIVQFIEIFVPIVLSGLAVVILLGRYWKRSTWQGAVAAIVLGSAVSALVSYVDTLREFWERPIIPALLVALMGQVVVSLLTSQKKAPFEEVALQMSEERKVIESE